MHTTELNPNYYQKIPMLHLVWDRGSTCLIQFQFENEYSWFFEKVAITLPT
jgi:hypothetical protein